VQVNAVLAIKHAYTMSDEQGSSSNTFAFADEIEVTVNENYLSIFDPDDPKSPHLVTTIYVLELKDKTNPCVVYKDSKGLLVYELETTPIQGSIFERFLGFLTKRMKYISTIKPIPYMERFGFEDDKRLKKGLRFSFDEKDYNIFPKGPMRNQFNPGLQFNPYFVCCVDNR
jgi:hypothetical protein